MAKTEAGFKVFLELFQIFARRRTWGKPGNSPAGC
jgi:hypothetical protein